MRQRLGLDINVETLTYQESDRADAVEWLVAHGWQVRAVNNADEMARLGRPIPADLADESFTTRLLRAQLAAAD
jgi:O-methyltransferase involved in polyketide biosynthesis